MQKYIAILSLLISTNIIPMDHTYNPWKSTGPASNYNYIISRTEHYNHECASSHENPLTALSLKGDNYTVVTKDNSGKCFALAEGKHKNLCAIVVQQSKTNCRYVKVRDLKDNKIIRYDYPPAGQDVSHDTLYCKKVNDDNLPHSILFAGDDNQIITELDNEVKRCDLRTKEWESLMPTSNASSPCSLALSPNEKLIAIGKGNDLSVYDLRHPNVPIAYSPSDTISSVAFNDNNTDVAWGSNKGVDIMELYSELPDYHHGNDGINTVAWNPESDQLVTGSEDNILSLFDRDRSGNIVCTDKWKLRRPVKCLYFAEKGILGVVSSDEGKGDLCFFNVETNELEKSTLELRSHVRAGQKRIS